MQVIDPVIEKEKLTPYLNAFKSNFMPLSILEGHFGEVLVDDREQPKTIILRFEKFKLYFLAGSAESGVAAVYLSELPFPAMLFPLSEGWDRLLDRLHYGKWVKLKRYGFSNEKLSIAHLEPLRDCLSDAYQLKKIDLAIAKQILDGKKTEVTGEQLFGFSSPQDFMDRGIGYCIYTGDQMVSVGAAGAACSQGIEIQINTDKKHRRQGLASAVSAALIIDCLSHGIAPSWDAANEESADLAQKLGYTPTGEYDMYAYLKYPFLVKLRTFLRKIRGMDVEA